MKRFRLQDNVPDTYPKRSRDFQLMCNLFDLMNNGVKFDIDTIRSLSDTTYCRDSMLTYLQHKLGLFMSSDVTDETLRPILKCFPFILRKKGSKQGIIETICLFLTTMHSDGTHTVEVLNYGDGDMSGNYIISINVEATQQRIPNIDILDQLLKYIAPTGYAINYKTFVGASGFTTKTANSEEINILFVNESYGSVARTVAEYESAKLMENRIVGGANTTVIRYTDNRETDDTVVDAITNTTKEVTI